MYTCTSIFIVSIASGSTLNALGEISEVEEVVRLGRSGEEVGAHPPVYLHAGVHNGLRSFLHWGRKVGQETLGDGLVEKWMICLCSKCCMISVRSGMHGLRNNIAKMYACGNVCACTHIAYKPIKNI